MKRFGRLFDEVISARNLWRAWLDFRKGKRRRRSVLRFEADADVAAIRLHHLLAAGRYRPGAYRLLLVREPKRRLIAAAPVRDRVVHHAVHRVVAPLLNRSLVDTTYACLPGRGTHRAVIRFVRGLREHRFVLLLDVRAYFLTVDLAILKGLLARRLKERALLDLLGVIFDSGDGLYRRPDVVAALGLEPGFPPDGCGLPIGNLTSQWWGNLYLSGLDHFVKRTLKLPHAQRYLDDVTLFADSRAQLVEAREAVAEWLAEERHLALKRPDAPVRETTARLTYLGHRVGRAGADPTPQVVTRMRRRLRDLALRGRLPTLRRSIASYRGLLGVTGRDALSDDTDTT